MRKSIIGNPMALVIFKQKPSVDLTTFLKNASSCLAYGPSISRFFIFQVLGHRPASSSEIASERSEMIVSHSFRDTIRGGQMRK